MTTYNKVTVFQNRKIGKKILDHKKRRELNLYNN